MSRKMRECDGRHAFADSCSFLTIGSARYHKSRWSGQGAKLGLRHNRYWLGVGSSSCRRGLSALPCLSVNPLWYGAKHPRVTRLAPNETASGSNAGALSNKEKL
jgi:hypothetical protein